MIDMTAALSVQPSTKQCEDHRFPFTRGAQAEWCADLTLFAVVQVAEADVQGGVPL